MPTIKTFHVEVTGSIALNYVTMDSDLFDGKARTSAGTSGFLGEWKTYTHPVNVHIVEHKGKMTPGATESVAFARARAAVAHADAVARLKVEELGGTWRASSQEVSFAAYWRKQLATLADQPDTTEPAVPKPRAAVPDTVEV